MERWTVVEENGWLLSRVPRSNNVNRSATPFMSEYTFDEQGRFVITDYTHAPTFASFLPGIAGEMGIPMWVFYVNRGQGIASVGVESKNTPIMEFQPANKAYQQVSYLGFRTFLKMDGAYYEPFAPSVRGGVQRSMHIGMNELELREETAEYTARVLYFTLTGEPFAGLVRQVTITNRGAAPVHLAVLDGLPAVMPFGVENWMLKDLARTSEAWMGVFNLEQHIPFYRLRSSIVDKVEVEGFEAGHFYTTVTASERLPAIVDPGVVFGPNTALSQPDPFVNGTLDDLYRARQIAVGKTPCGFFGTERSLAAGEALTLYGIVAHVSHLDMVQHAAARISQPAYLQAQRAAAQKIVRDLTDAVAVQTSEPVFDAYTRQTFLDNVLRGGWPIQLGDVIQHIYSRKHGDLERDYNAYYLAPEFYSQGNGNFRDVNQNRREDVWLNPRVGDYNIVSFMNLIQADGYNPLVIYGNRFTVPSENHAVVLAWVDDPERLAAFLAKPFTPGALLKFLAVTGIGLCDDGSPGEFLDHTLRHAEQHFQAEPGEGYWTDHWTYNLDLIENYLGIYPERKGNLLFDAAVYTFYDSPMAVRPRAEKYVLSNGRVRQLNAVQEDSEKEALIASRTTHPNVMRNRAGEIVYTTLFGKLVSLALIKFATRDPLGMGIEMEAGKPGWYDALNGLPGLFGSAMPETYELARLLVFLREAICTPGAPVSITLPSEIAILLDDVWAAQHRDFAGDDLAYWDTVATARENYRARIRAGFDGTTRTYVMTDLDRALADFQAAVMAGIERAEALNDGVPPTYFIYHAEAYELLPDGQHVRVTRFEPKVLPLFLEGPVRALKIMDDPGAARDLHARVKASALYDRALGMYKVNASLDGMPPDIGRARAFTPGWLENESIWLHMEYKYLLGLLDAGLVEAFYEDFRRVLIPFQNPAVYGRSPLENSSFVVSSAHPDPDLHGRGFVARLSGSTVEFLSILHRMMFGQQPFFVQGGELRLRFAPALPGWLFDEGGKLVCTFLGNITVEYDNPWRAGTFGESGVRPAQITLILRDGAPYTCDGDTLGSPMAEQVRSGMVSQIRVRLERH